MEVASTSQDDLLEQVNCKLNAVIAVLLRLQEDGERQDVTEEARLLYQCGLPWDLVASIQGRTPEEVVKGVLQEELGTPEKYKAYSACDGNTNQTAIGKKAGVNQATVSTWSKQWRSLGLATQCEDGIKALWDPADLDVSKPE